VHVHMSNEDRSDEEDDKVQYVEEESEEEEVGDEEDEDAVVDDEEDEYDEGTGSSNCFTFDNFKTGENM
jgi:hypothetical protein